MDSIFNFKEWWSGESDQRKRGLLRLVSILLIAGAAFLFVETASILKEFKYIGAGVPATNVISVSGEGEVFAVPDIAEISFSAHAEGKSVSEAQKEVTETMNAAVDFLKKSGIAEKDIRTTSYSAYPRYEYNQIYCITVPCPPGKQTLAGYDVNHTILVKVRDTDNTGTILEGLGNMKLSDISGPNFSIDDDTVLQAEARKKAIDDAKAKAETLARDLGVKLVRIISFSETGDYPIYYAKGMALGMGGSVESATPNVPKGENKITSNVSITYEIR